MNEKRDPTNIKAVNQAKTLIAQADSDAAAKDSERAYSLYRAAIDTAPLAAFTHWAYGYALYQDNRFADAQAFIEKACELDDKNAEYHFYHGLCWQAIGKQKANFFLLEDDYNPEDFETALACLEKAHSLKHDDERYLLNLGECYMALKNYSAAAACFTHIIKLNEANTDAYKFLADCYNSTGREEQAVEYIKKALEKKPESIDLHKFLADIYTKMEKYENAESALWNAVFYESEHDSELYIQLVGVLKSQGKIQDAIEQAKYALKLAEHLNLDYIQLEHISHILDDLENDDNDMHNDEITDKSDDTLNSDPENYYDPGHGWEDRDIGGLPGDSDGPKPPGVD